jgi:glycosyltransferase involved in cell wall biosynthesis
MKRIAIIYNTMFYIYNFRLSLIRGLQAGGFDVLAIAPFDGYEKNLRDAGVTCADLPFKSSTTNPIAEIKILSGFLRFFKIYRPDCILSFTIKPNIYGSLAARVLGIPVINNITGLGSVFIKNNLLTRLTVFLYRISLHRSHIVFFQNEDDRGFFRSHRLVSQSRSGRIPGSGIDLARYAPQPIPSHVRFTFLFIGRLLRDKGIFELAAAAENLIRSGLSFECQLLGGLDIDNPTAVSRSQINRWETAGFIRYLGTTEDVRPYIAAADCIVLPSYREGLSRTLLEAAAMARPIIATDVPGCREVVDDGLNGFLCRPRDADDLAKKMSAMIALSSAQREEMGRRGRVKAEREFDESIVIRAYLDAVNGAVRQGKQKEVPA